MFTKRKRKLPEIDYFNFMTEVNVRSKMELLKLKNAEGFDRIPQRILIDGAELLNVLTNRLTVINNKIEYDWLNKSLNSFKLICKSLFLT